MARSDLDDLLESVEQARLKHCPDLPAKFIERVVLIERDLVEDKVAAMKAIQRLVEEFVPDTPGAD